VEQNCLAKATFDNLLWNSVFCSASLKPQTVQYLIEQGADVDALDLGDNVALHWAAMRGHVEIVNLLLMNGADKNMRNKQDKVPVCAFTITSCRHKIGFLLKELKC